MFESARQKVPIAHLEGNAGLSKTPANANDWLNDTDRKNWPGKQRTGA
jgi:hypothetical protein